MKSRGGCAKGSPLRDYLANTGMVVTFPAGVARRPMTLIQPPAGVTNSMVPRFPSAAAEARK